MAETRLNLGLTAAVRPATACGSLASSGYVAKPLRLLSLAATVFITITTIPATAAPVLPSDTMNSAGATPGTPLPATNPPGIISGASEVDVPNQSKTIEMLLEMQGKNPGLAGGERPRQEVPTGVRPASRPAAPAPSKPFGVSDPANPFGAPDLAPGKAPAAPQDTAVDWNAGPSAGLGTGGLSSGGAPQRDFPGRPTRAGGASEDDDVRWLIPRRVVRFVRENRETVVVGSVVVLLLLWGATAMASGRRK
jgi:hypothetical protein